MPEEADFGKLAAAVEALRADIGELIDRLGPPPPLYCPPETIEEYTRRRKGTSNAPGDQVVCPGGWRLRRHPAQYAGAEAKRAADRLWHQLPDDNHFLAAFSGRKEDWVRNHNVWKSRALTYQQVVERGLTPYDPLDDVDEEPAMPSIPEETTAAVAAMEQMERKVRAQAPEQSDEGWQDAYNEFGQAFKQVREGCYGGQQKPLWAVFELVPAMYPLRGQSRIKRALAPELKEGTRLLMRRLELGSDEAFLAECGVQLPRAASGGETPP